MTDAIDKPEGWAFDNLDPAWCSRCAGRYTGDGRHRNCNECVGTGMSVLPWRELFHYEKEDE